MTSKYEHQRQSEIIQCEFFSPSSIAFKHIIRKNDASTLAEWMHYTDIYSAFQLHKGYMCVCACIYVCTLYLCYDMNKNGERMSHLYLMIMLYTTDDRIYCVGILRCEKKGRKYQSNQYIRKFILIQCNPKQNKFKSN